MRKSVVPVAILDRAPAKRRTAPRSESPILEGTHLRIMIRQFVP